MFRKLLTMPVLLAIGLPVLAQEASVPPRKLTLKAAAAPVPALKYRLLPEIAELEPGNALLYYMRAGNWVSKRPTDEEFDKWGDMPLVELKKERVDAKLPMFALADVDRGARRMHCDWEELMVRIRKHGFEARNEEIQVIRQFAYWLSLRARWEMANGQLEKGLYSLQTMLAMSRHLEMGPTLIQHLVGIAVASMAMGGVEELIQQPGAPNLYWALTALPRPFLDFGKALESERLGFEVYFPEIKKLGKEPLSQQELTRLTNICADFNLMVDAKGKDPTFAEKLELVGKVAQRYPTARKALIDQGHKSELVDTLPMLQVVVLYNYQEFRRVQDDMLKWCFVPFAEGIKGREQVDYDCRLLITAYPFGALLPAVQLAFEGNVRLDRRIAALRCIEAVRMHLATTGKLPASLGDIKMVPIPLDPATGKAFQYDARGDVVTLFGPPTREPAHEGNTINYSITFEKR